MKARRHSILIWILGITGLLIVLAVGSLLFLVQSEWLESQARIRAIGELESRFNVQVEIRKIDLDVWSGSAQIHDLRLTNRAVPTIEPAIEIDTITVNFSIADLLAERPDIDRISLQRPIFRLLQDENGRLNLLNMFAPETATARPEQPETDRSKRLILELLSIDQGTIRLNQEVISFSTVARGLDLQASYQRRSEQYSGSVDLKLEGIAVDSITLPISRIATDFSLSSDRLELAETRIESDSLNASVSGEFSSLSQLDYRFDVDLETDLGQPSTLDFLSAVSAGKLRTTGQALGQGSHVTYQGEVTTSDLSIDRFAIKALNGSVTIDNEALFTERLSGEYLGGILSIGGKLAWKEGQSRFATTLKGGRIGPLLRLADAPPLPITGTVSADVDFSWPSMEFAELKGRGSATYSGNIKASDTADNTVAVPFTGNTVLDLDLHRLDLTEGLLTTPGSTASYQMEFPYSGVLNLKTELQSEEASELLEIAERLGLVDPQLQTDYPFDVAGPAAITADLSLPEEPGLTIDAVARLEQASYDGVPLGRIRSTVHYEPGYVSLEDVEVVSADYRATGSVSIPATMTPEEPLRGRVRLERASIGGLRPHLPDIPEGLEGLFSGSGEFTWSSESGFAATVQALIEKADAWGESIDRLIVEGGLKDQVVEVRRLEMATLRGQLLGTGRYDFSQGATSFDVRGSGFDIAAIRALRSEEDGTPTVEGMLKFDARGKGTYPDLEIDLDAHLPEVKLAGQTIEDVTLTSTARRQMAQVDLGFQAVGLPLRASGNLQLQDPYSFTMTMDLEEIPVETALSEALQQTPEFSGTLSGMVVATGTLKEPAATRVEFDLKSAHLITRHSPVEIEGIDTIQFQNGTLDIPGIHITGQGTDLTGSGQLDLKGDGKISLKIEGEVNLQLTGTLLDEGAMSGLGIIDTDIVGSLEDPRIVGNIQIENGQLSHPALPISLSEVQGEFKFTTNQISIDSFTANTAYGSLSLEGGIFLDGFAPTRWQVNAYGYGLRFEFVDGLVSVLDVNLDLVKSEASQLISGAVYIRSAEYLDDVSVADLILRIARGRAAAVPSSGPDDIALDIDIEAYRSLRVQNNLADVVASGDFAVVGTLNNPVILGTLTVDEGSLFFEGNTYDVTRGILSFNNPRVTTPYLNIEAETEVREFTVTILLRGSTDDLKSSFRSDPPLSTANIITLLTSGQTQEELFGTGGSQTASSSLAVYGAGTLLSRALGEAISTQTNRLFGLNKFSIDPFVDSSRDRDPGARVTLGKTITKGLDVTYITNLGGDLQDQTLIVEYRLTNWLTLVGTSQSDGTVAMDFKFRKRF